MCASPYGCSGAGEVDWVVPLQVKQIEPVRATRVADPISAGMASTFGLQATQVENVPLFNALIAEASPIYILALNQYILVTGLIAVSKGQIVQNPLIGWQAWLTSQTWLWVLAWVIVVLLVGLLDNLRGSKRLPMLGAGLSLLTGLGIWLVFAPLVVEVFFLPQYLWPGGTGKLFLYFGWGRVLLAFVMSIPVLFGIVLATIRAGSMPNCILLALQLLPLDYGRFLFGVIGLGLIAWAGIFVGASFVAWVSGRNWITGALLQNGLTMATNVSFIILSVQMAFGGLLFIIRQAVANRQRQKELANA